MRIDKVYIFAAIVLMFIAAISGCVEERKENASVPMNVSMVAVRGGYPAEDSKTYQYEIELRVKNNVDSDIIFDTIGLYYMVEEKIQPLAYPNTGPEKKWTIKPGNTLNFAIDSGDRAMESIVLAKSRGLDKLVLAVIFFNDSRYVHGLYGSLIPLVENLPHESEGRGILLDLNMVTPGKEISEENMTEFYDMLPLPNNKMGKAVEPIPAKQKVEPSPEITTGPGFSEPTFAIIGFVTLDSSPMSSGLEYKIDLVIQSATDHPVTFNKIEVKYYDQSYPLPVISSIGSTTLEYSQVKKTSVKTLNLQEMQNKVENAGKKTIVMYIRLKNGEENVGGEYSASLPPLSYMETSKIPFQMTFALDNDPLYASKAR